MLFIQSILLYLRKWMLILYAFRVGHNKTFACTQPYTFLHHCTQMQHCSRKLTHAANIKVRWRKTQIQNLLQRHRSKLESFKSNTTKLKEQDIQCLQIYPLYRMDGKNTGMIWRRTKEVGQDNNRYHYISQYTFVQ